MTPEETIEASKALLALERERERQVSAVMSDHIRRLWREAEGIPEPATKPKAPPGWHTHGEAAQKFYDMREGFTRDYPALKSITIEAAGTAITKACVPGGLESIGTRKNRRIDPASFNRWLVKEREKMLSKVTKMIPTIQHKPRF